MHLVTGDDESLVRAAVTDLVHRLVGDGDRSLMVDEFDDEDVELGAVVDDHIRLVVERLVEVPLVGALVLTAAAEAGEVLLKIGDG